MNKLCKSHESDALPAYGPPRYRSLNERVPIVSIYCCHYSANTFRSNNKINSKALVYLSGVVPKRNYYATATDNQSGSSPDNEPGYSISRDPYIGDPFSDASPFRGL